MNGIHDLGGMHGFGPIEPEIDEPVFHMEWERRVFALVSAVAAARLVNTDQFRHAIERMPPAEYLRTSYFEHWLHALETLLLESGRVTAEELGRQSPSLPPAGTESKQRLKPRTKARFKAGDAVIARNINPVGHTRSPRYVRGRRGTIVRDHGVFAFPDTTAHGAGRNPQHCYSVAFGFRELWGTPTQDRLYIDLWEEYLEPAPAKPVRSTKKGKVKRGRRSSTGQS